ncbi:DNA mismatch repair protein MutT [Brachybacterium avium]|uniref:8-oxo-dGTP diphosphatase n=1 Tax=Brachybacterium avium TaxID=2017485 RepID=A0A220UDA6_9MICO|nr:DNA mismatch repair protein MutT [Brachybacterium avium]
MVGAIIRRSNTVFAARRNTDRSAGGLWEFPGGKVEPGETPEEALKRELREELDIDVSVGRFVDKSISDVAGVVIELSCYTATLVDTEPTSSTDHDAMAWIDLNDLDQFEWAPGDVPIIERLILTLPETWAAPGPTR